MENLPALLKEVLDSSMQLSGWAIAIAGGTIAVIIGSSTIRPRLMCWRLPYLLFFPAWILMGVSIYLGNVISGKYLASLMASKCRMEILGQINDLYADQRNCLMISLVFLALWLSVYTIYWIFFNDPDELNK